MEDAVRARLDGFAADIRVDRRAVTIEHPSVEAMWEFQRRNAGPLVAARMALGDRFEELAAKARGLIAELKRATDGTARVEFDYLLVVATNNYNGGIE